MKTVMKLMVMGLMSVVGMNGFASKKAEEAPKYGLSESESREYPTLLEQERQSIKTRNELMGVNSRASGSEIVEAQLEHCNYSRRVCEAKLKHYKAKVDDATSKFNTAIALQKEGETQAQQTSRMIKAALEAYAILRAQ